MSPDQNTRKISSESIRSRYVEFFKRKGHAEISAAPLLAENDSTLLFVNSGMFPLVPYLLGETHPAGNRLVNYQRSFRTSDIEEIGDRRHTTMFEMLGNWSLGDYFKNEQLNYWYEFLVEELGLDPNQLYQSVYGGNEHIPADTESIGILHEIFAKYGVEAATGPQTHGRGEDGPGVEIDFTSCKIFPYTDKNWWQRGDTVGELGGPDSETFFDTGRLHDPAFGEHCHVNCDCGRFIEIGNSVFMQYVKTADGWEKLSKRNVDFGGGLERLVTVCSGQNNIFKTDLFDFIIGHLETISGRSYESEHKKFEIIADHMRASVFLIGDGGMPSNKDQGYFIRRLLRRSLLQMQLLSIDFSELNSIAEMIIGKMAPVYPKLGTDKARILQTIADEVQAFSNTLLRGLKHLEKALESEKIISGDVIFELHATYGIPFELVKEYASSKGLQVDEEDYARKTEEHKNISKVSSEKKFKSGLADTSAATVKYHTATHLLHSALHQVLGPKANQKGSNITSERLRFDFSHDSKVTPEQLSEIEKLVNGWISSGFEVRCEEMSIRDAADSGAVGLFTDKYDEVVKVFTVSDYDSHIISKEICTGPHVTDSDDFGVFEIMKEEAVASGVRRIKAILK